jgi:hypothetical protein
MAADLEAVRRGEEHHPDGIPHDGFGDGALVDHQGIQAAATRGNGARQSDGTGSND